MIDHISPDFGHWFAGLVDGEGSFGMTLGVRPKNIPNLQFGMGLRSDDKAMLDYIHQTLGVGTRYDYGKGRTSTDGYKCNPVSHLVINNKAGVGLLVELFRKYPLRSKKKREFELWAEASEIWLSRNWNGPMTKEKMKYALQMQDMMRRLSAFKKYDSSLGEAK